MDLTTRSFDLTRALIDLSSTYSMKDASLRIIKWLARERIDDANFTACCKLASSLAYPNDKGMKIHKRLQDADKKILGIQQAPISLVVSGSLGRLLSYDPEYCYMVSSVAALTEYHAPIRVADVLCSMILDKGGHQEEVSYKYDVQRAPIKAVISKIVESIYINVVNSGHSMGGLPEELKQLHPHLLDATTFAGIVMGIQRSDKDIVIGILQAVAETRIIFEKRLGAVSRTIKLLIKKECPIDETCTEQDASIIASESVGNATFTFLRGYDDTEYQPCSDARQDLYSTTNLMSSPHSSRAIGLNKAHENHITAVAKNIVMWLLEVPLNRESRALEFSFGANIKEDAKAEGLTIGYLLANHPGIAQKKTGEFAMSGPTFRLVDESDESSETSGEALSTPEPTDIIKFFPYAQAMLDDMGVACKCANCAKALRNLRDSKPGCLRLSALTKLLHLVGHAIADAYGAQNVSGVGDPETQVPLIVKVLSELIYDQVVCWDTWSRLVVSIVTGCDADPSGAVEDAESGNSSYIALQYGNVVAAAPWIDLTKPSKIRGSFGLSFLEGNIAGLPDELGFLECENSEYVTTIPKSPKARPSTVETRVKMQASENDQIEPFIPGPEQRFETIAALQDASQIDTFKVKVVTAVFRIESHRYPYMTTVEAGTRLHIIDPTYVLRNLCFSKVPNCDHKLRSEKEESVTPDIPVRTDDFERILSRWNPAHKKPGTPVAMSKLLDTRLKINVALSLAYTGCVIRHPKKCCIDCAITEATRLGNTTSPRIINAAVVSPLALQAESHAQ
ncbi:MAG: hypothetical protein Q9225_007212 [Loekoesia sp. 1 TL-2023]